MLDNQQYKSHFFKFIRFAFIGLINTCIDYGVFTLLVYVGVYFIYAHITSYITAALNSYVCNSLFTFKQKKIFNLKRIVTFSIVNIVSLLITTLFIWIFKEKVGFHEWLAKLFAMPFGFIVNYLGNSLVVFSEKQSRQIQASKTPE